MNARTRLATLASVSALALVGLAGCGDEAQDPASADSTPTRAAEPGDDPTEPSESASESTADTTTVPVYFAGDTPQGQRLFREFRKVDGADPLGKALTLAASGDALDPDYSTLLPAGTFAGGTTDEMVSIPLPDDSWTLRPDGMSEDEALLAVQQIVYTAQGVLQERTPIVFTDTDGNATQIFGIASEDGFSAADPIETLALVSVTSPEQGATVSGTFTASGVSSSFEATTPWEVRRGDADGKVVKKGFATAEGWMDKLYPWETEVDVSGLPAGDYTFVAMTDDPSGGEGGGPTVDTKSITIK